MKHTALCLVLLVAACGSKGGGSDADAGDAPDDVTSSDGGDAVEDPLEEGPVPDAGCTSDPDCDDSDPCTEDVCDTALGECSHEDVDADEDGYAAAEVDGTACSGTDCDDDDIDIHPGATELCDTIDQDCNGSWADAGADDDEDGYLDEACGGDDCDDDDDRVHPGAAIVCLDGVDQDCDTVADGVQLADVRLTTLALNSWSPQVVWSGSEYGITWDDETHGATEIYFLRVGADGARIGPDVRVTSTSDWSTDSALAWTGSEYVTCWQDARDGDRDIFCRRIGADGTLPGAETRVTSTTAAAETPAVVSAGSQVGVAWVDYRGSDADVWFQRLALDGSPLGGNVRITDDAGSSLTPTIAWSGSEFGTCWEDSRDSYTNVYCARISAGGAKVGSEVDVSVTLGYSELPWMVWSGSEYAVAWVDDVDSDEEIYVARFSPTLVKEGSSTRLTTSAGWASVPWLAWTGSDYAVAWYDERSGTAQVFVKYFTADASTLGGDLQVTTTTTSSYYPSIAWSGSMFGLAWDDVGGSNREIWFNLLATCD